MNETGKTFWNNQKRNPCAGGKASMDRWIDRRAVSRFLYFSKVEESGYSWARRIFRFWVIRSGQCTSGPLFDARHKKNVNGAGTIFFLVCSAGHVADEGKVSPTAEISAFVLRWGRNEIQSGDIVNWNSRFMKNVPPMSALNRRSISFEYLHAKCRFACKRCSAERSRSYQLMYNLRELARKSTSFASVFRVDV